MILSCINRAASVQPFTRGCSPRHRLSATSRVRYLHEFDLASSVFFRVGLRLGLALQILEFFLQRLLPERGLVPLPLAPLQFLLLLRQLQPDTATRSRMKSDRGSSPAPRRSLSSDPIGAIWGNLAINLGIKSVKENLLAAIHLPQYHRRTVTAGTMTSI